MVQIYKAGTLLNNGRYKIVNQLGQGVFGLVMEALALQSSQKVAIKIVRDTKECKE